MAIETVDNSSPTSGDLHSAAWSKYNATVTALLLTRNADGTPKNFVVAANDSSSRSKNSADFLCDGTADEVQIQAAIDALPAGGGTVLLLEGTYTIAAQINAVNNLTLVGIGQSSVIDYTPATGTLFRIATGDDNVTIENLKIKGNASATSGELIYMEGGTPSNCKVLKVYFEGGWIPVRLHTCNSIAVTNCSFVGFKRLAFNAYRCEKIFFCNNYVHNTDNTLVQPDVLFQISDYCVCSNNIVIGSGGTDGFEPGIGFTSCDYATISNNVSKNHKGSGIALDKSGEVANGSRYCSITGNVCADNGQEGITLYKLCHYNTIVGNVCKNNYHAGIEVWRCSYCIVASNEVVGNVDGNGMGINIFSEDDISYGNIIKGNLVKGNKSYGIFVKYQIDTLVEGNSCLGNNQGDINSPEIFIDGGGLDGVPGERTYVFNNIARDGYVGIKLGNSIPGCVIRGNICLNNSTAQISDGGTGTIQSHNITS